MTGVEIEKVKINLNTVIGVVGFLSTFALVVGTWVDARNDQEDVNKWIAQHTQLHDAIAMDLQHLHQVDASRDTQVAEISLKIGALEKGVDAVNDRVGRVTESYSNQFTEMRGQMGTIITQQALTNQSLQRLEAHGKGAALFSDPPTKLSRE